MRHSAHITVILAAIIGVVLPTGLSGSAIAYYESTNSTSIIDIEDINIAPLNTPTIPKQPKRSPTPGAKITDTQRKPTETPIQRHVLPQIPPPPERVNDLEAADFFSFSFSQTEVDFGIIDPTNPVVRTHLIGILPGKAQGYTLYAYQNHQLQANKEQTFIPDTSCDDGTCSESISGPWQNTLTYGFGFRCDEDGDIEQSCVPEFAEDRYYKQFGDVAKKELGSPVIRSYSAQPSAARITYKVNVPGTQEPKAYTNSLVYIATPTF